MSNYTCLFIWSFSSVNHRPPTMFPADYNYESYTSVYIIYVSGIWLVNGFTLEKVYLRNTRAFTPGFSRSAQRKVVQLYCSNFIMSAWIVFALLFVGASTSYASERSHIEETHFSAAEEVHPCMYSWVSLVDHPLSHAQVADQALNSPCAKTLTHVEGICHAFGVNDPLCGSARAHLLEKCPSRNVITRSDSK